MKKLISSVLALCMLIGVLAACGKAPAESQSPATEAPVTEKVTEAPADDGGTLTLMMYVVGADLESEGGCASMDFEELLNSSVDLGKVNILIYTGGATKWKRAISAEANSIYKVKPATGGSKMMYLEKKLDSAKNMGEADTLVEFLEYGKENYPADRYALICWDHGGGPLRGFGSDELHDRDGLELSELTDALSRSPFSGGNKLSWIGFDACLMGSVEIGNALSDYAEYMVASENLEPGTGWDYSFLSDINDDLSPEAIGAAIVKKYQYANTEAAAYGYGTDYTLSCVDLSKVSAVGSALDSLFARVNTDFISGIRSRVAERQNLFGFGNEAVPADGRGTEPDLVDLGALSDSLSGDYSSEADALRSAIDGYVVSSCSNMTAASGVSVYYPFAGMLTYKIAAQPVYGSYSVSGEYSGYIDMFTRTLYGDFLNDAQTRSRSVSKLSNAESGKDKITVTLTDEQKKSFARAYVNVMFKLEDLYEYDERVSDVTTDRGYAPVLLNAAVKQNADGNLEIDPNVLVPVAYSENDSIIWPMEQIYAGADESRYQSLYAQVTSNIYAYPFAATENIVINTALKNGETEMTIKNMLYSDSGSTLLGKESVDMNDWSSYLAYYHGYDEKTDAKGNLLPADQWEKNGEAEIGDVAFDSNIKFKMVPLNELKNRDFYYQVVIEDTKGVMNTSKLFSFNLGEKSRDVKEKTAKGELIYEVFADRAEVKWYKGTDKKLTIPAKFQNKPVTCLQSEFFSTESTVEEMVIESADTALSGKSFFAAKIGKLTLPKGLKAIPDQAFLCSYISKLELPSSVERIGTLALAYCYDLSELKIPAGVKEILPGAFAYSKFEKGVSFDGANKNYKIEKNSLLSADGKTLYARFGGGETYAVPNGVEVVESWSCAGELTKVTLPDSLKEIRSDAFRNHELKSLTIPDSVEIIGNNAFANYTATNMHGYKQMDSLKIGKGLRLLGREVFGTVSLAKVEVDKDNEYFSSKDGKLMTKTGDSAIAVNAAE